MNLCFLVALTAAAISAQTLDGVVDLHAHSDPDSVPRSIDFLSLVKLAKAKNYGGLVLKNHYEPTASWAAISRLQTPGIAVFGGVALNLSMGGINPAAIDRMAKVSGAYGRIVWMPTFDSENQVKTARENRPYVSVSSHAKLLPIVHKALDAISRNSMVLATGHSTPTEDFMLIREAKKRGVKWIVVTHGMLAPVSMTVTQMKEAVTLGAMVEFVGNAVVGTTKSFTFEQYADAMRRIGIENCILSSDFGQKGNPLHPDGMLEVFAGLRKAGLSVAEIEMMAKTNPGRVLGLKP